jgi:cellulase (glycosyl hydrolase family 5)
MSASGRRRRRWAIAVAAAALGVSGATPAADAQAPALGFDFESAGQASAAWAAGACNAPTWLAGNDGAATQSVAVVHEGQHSLALPIRMTGGSFDQAGADCVLPDPRPADLTPFTAVVVDVFAPTAGLKADVVFNDPWRPPSTPPRDLVAGWNTLTYDITPSSPDFPGGVQEGKEIVLRLIGQGVTFTGVAYFDNVRFAASAAPSVQVLAPERDETITTPTDQPFTIRARATASAGRSLSSVTWSVGSQSGTLTVDGASGEWRGAWDVWRSGDGVRTLTIRAQDSTGDVTATPVVVLVRNSALRVQAVRPAFDAQLRGRTTGEAKVKPDARFGPPHVRLVAGRLRIPASLGPADADGWRTARFSLDTRALHDGVQTLRIEARDRRFRVVADIDTTVENRPAPAGLVRAAGTRFRVAHGAPFRFVGWNEYELFTRVDQTTEHVQETVSGRVIPKGTTITWREQIDRQMLEAERHHLTVLRTWAFDDNPDTFAFQPQLGVYNEDAFRKLDYIMDSARRHRTRVILTFTNYWGDYGGIGRYTEQLGLANKLQFFTDPQARAYYERYVAHLVNRVNTVNGVAYKSDPTVFSWELMNEPRDDCADDPTPDKRYCDPTGRTLHEWVARESAYVKSLDSRHMVDAGAEAHGLVQTPSGPFQWARADEGGGNDPWATQDAPAIDFVTFHPYPNASWAQFTFAQTHDLITGLARTGVKRGKPVVMSEYGIFRSQPITDRSGQRIAPGGPSFADTRVDWYRMLLADCYDNGCAGTNIWMLADWSDPDLNVNLYLPKADAMRDAPIVSLLDAWGARLGP